MSSNCSQKNFNLQHTRHRIACIRHGNSSRDFTTSRKRARQGQGLNGHSVLSRQLWILGRCYVPAMEEFAHDMHHLVTSTTTHMDRTMTQLQLLDTGRHNDTREVCTDNSRSLPGIPDHRAPSAFRGQPHPQDLPHARLCAQRGRCQVAILVLLGQAPQDQEGER